MLDPVQLDVEDDDNGFIASPPPFGQLRCHATRGPDQPTPGRGFLVFFLEFFCLNTFVGRPCQSDSQKYGICFSSIPFCNLVWFGGHQENRPRIVSTKFQQSNQKYSPLRTVYVNQRNRLPLVANGVKPTEHLCAAWRIPRHHPPRLCGTLHFAQAGKRALWYVHAIPRPSDFQLVDVRHRSPSRASVSALHLANGSKGAKKMAQRRTSTGN